jgi:UDP-N-acetylglucosamine--N-acetylmuramyl-(pentapeptide) pyrophosphoryl-undecaprenol N-acetylglucosamine transferase
MRMKVMIAAGGTGGHIYPGIAVANEILRRDPSSEVLFVGTSRGLETRIVPENGFQLALIHSVGLKNVGLKGKAKGLMTLPRSFVESRRLLREFRPTVVVGAGGYVSGPVLMMSVVMGIPTLVMDSNALPGFTNRRLAKFVERAALTFQEAVPYFAKKGTVTGNPVRKEFFDVTSKGRIDNTTSVLIFGGSQGARPINNAMIGALEHLNGDRETIRVVHQTGESDYERVRTAYLEHGWESADVRPYISDMMSEFERANILICRAGATTCAEIAASGKAAIMIPLPTAADDHQRKNAEAMQNAGAAKMLVQDGLTPELLASTLTHLAGSPEKIAAMEKAARKLAREDAAERTVDIIEELARD